MDNKQELESFARMIIQDDRFPLVMSQLKDNLATRIFSSKQDENHSRDDSYSTWKGAEAFMGVLQSYIDNADIELKEEEAKKQAIELVRAKERAKQDAIKGL